MHPDDIRSNLAFLNTSQVEVALLLGVNARTVRRWINGTQNISGAAEQALAAWVKLHKAKMAWRPDSMPVFKQDAASIAAHNHEIELSELIKRVEVRGGPSLSWKVDLKKCSAVLGPMHLSFYKLENGSFSPSFYRRTDDVSPDRHRDQHLIDDACYCISKALKL